MLIQGILSAYIQLKSTETNIRKKRSIPIISNMLCISPIYLTFMYACYHGSRCKIFLFKYFTFLGSQPPRGMTSPSPRHQQDSRSPREFAGGGGMPPSTSPAILQNQGKTHPGLKVVIPNSSRQVSFTITYVLQPISSEIRFWKNLRV